MTNKKRKTIIRKIEFNLIRLESLLMEKISRQDEIERMNKQTNNLLLYDDDDDDDIFVFFFCTSLKANVIAPDTARPCFSLPSPCIAVRYPTVSTVFL